MKREEDSLASSLGFGINLKLKPFGVFLSIDIVVSILDRLFTESTMSTDNRTAWVKLLNTKRKVHEYFWSFRLPRIVRASDSVNFYRKIGA